MKADGSMTEIPYRGFGSHNAEEITGSDRMVFRWRDFDSCVSGKFYRDVTPGTTDHGQCSQEEIWTLIRFLWTYALLVIERFLPLLLS